MNDYETSPEAAYHNFSIEEGFSYGFTVDITDALTMELLDLTTCTITLTAYESGSENPTFLLSSTAGDIIINGNTGLLEIIIPGDSTSGLLASQLIYDVVITDEFSVSRLVVKGFLTICPAVD
jgi:hypothetical protein